MKKGKWRLIEFWDGKPCYEVAFWEDETDDVFDGWDGDECYIAEYTDNKLDAEQYLQEQELYYKENK
tara:strand:+ start:1121 stop:1321 length:201 start_codon:yes stop_codon:yes gene_type:complete